MRLLDLVLFEIAYYGGWWLLFISFSFLAGFFLKWAGPFIAIIAVSLAIVFLDINWVYDEMRHHSENGRDFDFPFVFGVLARLVLFNLLLLPFSFIGWRLANLRKQQWKEVSDKPRE